MNFFTIIFGNRNANADVLRERLSHGVVVFTYRTKSGCRRKAIGTRNLDLARRMGYYVPTANRRTGRRNPNCYFDLERGWWRSFRPENVISIDG